MKKFLIILIVFLSVPIAARAQEVDLLWQGETYTPPFYEGKALWSHQSRITLVAIPHGLGNSASLNYKWTKNGTVLGNINGVGKNTLSFVDSVISRPQTIKVEILDGDKSVLASNSVYITPQPPSLAVYENNPLYGFMFNKEITEYEMREKEVAFAAFPFFFSASSRIDPTLAYEWKSNAGGVDTQSSVTYRSPDEGSGLSRITVKIKKLETLLQSANKNLLIKFNNNNINNLGL